MKIFLALLRDSIWRSGTERLPRELNETATTEVFELAKKQAVSGLVFDAIIRNDVKIPQQWVFEAIGLLGQIKQRSRVINEGVVKLNKLMAEECIGYVIVKGQVVASKYPDPLLRQSGDIDYYCDASNYLLSQGAIKKYWGIEPEREKSDLHVHFDYQDVTYEGHFSLTRLYGKKREEYWQQLLDNDGGDMVVIGRHHIKTLSPTLHTLYVFIHLYNHLLALGVGLRQFCDLAVMLHYNVNSDLKLKDNILEPSKGEHVTKGRVNINELRTHLKALGMERAYRACGSILVDYLGLSEAELGYSLTDNDRSFGKKILDVVIYRGNMGHYNKRNGFSGWKHKVEALGIKVSHFIKFMPLAPEYSRGWLWHEITRQAK